MSKKKKKKPEMQTYYQKSFGFVNNPGEQANF